MDVPVVAAGSGDLEGRVDVALNIIRPLVRHLSEMFTQDHELQLLVKNVEGWTQKLLDPLNHRCLEILNHMAKEVHRFLCSVAIDFDSFRLYRHSTTELMVCQTRQSPEDVVHFLDSTIHILSCICNHEYIHQKDPHMKENISLALDELLFLRNMSWKNFSEIPAALSLLICSSVIILVDSNMLVRITHINQYMPKVRDRIHTHVQLSSHPVPDVDDNVLKFFDFVLDKLKKSGNQMETAIHELSFLRSNLFDVLLVYSLQGDSAVKEMDSLTFSAVSLIIEIGRRTYFSIPFSQDMVEAVDLLKLRAGDLLASYKIFNLSPSGPSSSTSNMDLVDCLIKNHEVVRLRPQIKTYWQEMEFVRNFLANDEKKSSDMKFFMARFNELAQQSNLIIGSFLRGEGSLWYHKLGLFVVTNEVRMTFRKMKASVASDIHIASLVPENPSKHSTISAAISVKKSINKDAHTKLVGVKDAAIEIISLLTRGERSRKIISIVGMAGLGKTTVANYVYEQPSINMHFHVLAWCRVSQVYKRETLLADLLSQIVGETNQSLEEVSGDDLANMIRRNLKGRKYLIVMDDVWDIKVWQELEMVFPEDDNGSRILFTTRHRDVAPKYLSQHYDLRLLSVLESCELLWLKVFDGYTCPPELSIISKCVVRSCKGLPLAVVMVAGILKGADRRKESWEQVAGTVKGLQGMMSITEILELSYKHLPVGLKSCFLFFAAFPEDTTISVSNLIRLWISQGFVQEENLGLINLEEEAERYLDELIDRSLVMIAKRSSSGGVKACRIHSVLHNFCSRKEHTMSEVTMFGGKVRCHHHSIMFHRLYSVRIQATNPGAEERERTLERSVNTEGAVFIDKFDLRRGVQSEGVNNGSGLGDTYTLIFQHKYLRVLDLGKVRMESSADTRVIIMIATTFVHLRFLGIRPRTNEIPAEIGNFLKLETLILAGVIGYVKLPESLWKLSRLRNVLIDHGFFNFQGFSKHFSENFSLLYDLKSVCTLSLRHGADDVEQHFLKRLPNLRKLACRFVYSWNEAKGCCDFPVLSYLNKLASLKLLFSGMVRYPCSFSFPSNLKKLSLSNSRLPWDQASLVMRQLPNVEVLKLLNKAFEGRQWNMEDGATLFPKLKFLKLDSLDVQEWNDRNVEDEPFPCLEELVVLSCPELEEVPACFGEISTLQSIEMKWCSSSAMDSVQLILQAQRDFSNDQLKVTLIGSA